MNNERVYSLENPPLKENLDLFAPGYAPEKFTEEEIKYLKPFFNNLDKPVFTIKNLPEEMSAALSSRYSRSTKSLRRVFYKEYVFPTAFPEKQKNWSELSQKEKDEKILLKNNFNSYVEYLNSTGGIENLVSIQRSRQFFEKWLALFGDDSIAEMGNVHICVEGLSNIAVKEIESVRIGISPLEKSTRFVSFSQKKADGSWQYVIPGELKGIVYEKPYTEAMNSLFRLYSLLQDPYLEYIKNKYPKSDDETDSSFNGSRSAKRFDDLRDLLPFSTQTNVALSGNGRALEGLINKLLSSRLGEVRYWGKEIYQELNKIIPSFLTRISTERGTEAQLYRRNLDILSAELSEKMLGADRELGSVEEPVKLIGFEKDADIQVVACILFKDSKEMSYSDVFTRVSRMSKEKRAKIIQEVLQERKFNKENPERAEVRFKKVPRAFEMPHYIFSITTKGGDYKDLQRHRMLTQFRQYFGISRRYELEDDVIKSPFYAEIRETLVKYFSSESPLYKMYKDIPEIAQYATPFTFFQHWVMKLSARELYWMIELRTGKQGHPCYRKICQEMARKAIKATPSIFQGLAVDWNDYTLPRRESEIKKEQKINNLPKS